MYTHIIWDHWTDPVSFWDISTHHHYLWFISTLFCRYHAHGNMNQLCGSITQRLNAAHNDPKSLMSTSHPVNPKIHFQIILPYPQSSKWLLHPYSVQISCFPRATYDFNPKMTLGATYKSLLHIGMFILKIMVMKGFMFTKGDQHPYWWSCRSTEVHCHRSIDFSAGNSKMFVQWLFHFILL